MENQATLISKAQDMVLGIIKSCVLGVLTKNYVFEEIANQPKTADEIAQACNLNKNVLARTLRFIAEYEIFEINDDKFSLTPFGQMFLKNTPGNVSFMTTFINQHPWTNSWHNFEYTLKTGEPSFDDFYKMPFFEFLEKNQEFGKPFNDISTNAVKMIAPIMVEAYDFSGFDTICDVGGGQGFLLKAILEKNRNQKGILFDLENTVKSNVVGDFGNRVQIIAGSFFENIPVADCIILKAVIHDWSDDNSVKILSNCKKALSSGGKIIMIERVLSEKPAAIELYYDLHMKVLIGGAERNRAEFEKLLSEVGLKIYRIIDTKSPFKIVEAGE